MVGLIGTAASRLVLAQAMVPPTGMEPEKKPMTAEQRMQTRFPQNVRVGDLIGLPVLDDSSSTLGHVREVVRTKGDKIELIVGYGGFLGWDTRPVAVPIEVVGIQGRELASLDMPPSRICKGPDLVRFERADPAFQLHNQDRTGSALGRRDAGSQFCEVHNFLVRTDLKALSRK